jgi:hypothetical protein
MIHLPDDPASVLIPVLSQLADGWFEGFTQPGYGHKTLTVTALKRYLAELSTLQLPETRYLLFPCNFEIYASCIEELLRTLIAFESADTITAWTILSLGLPRWYNLSLEDVEDDPRRCLTYTRPDWEKYKQHVADIAKHQDAKANVQMRRIVAPFHEDAVSNLYVYNNNGAALELHQAQYIIDRRPKCLELLEELQETIKSRIDSNTLVHLVAQHKSHAGRCSIGDGHWIRLLDDFKRTFHTKEHSRTNPIADNKRGVYCGFVEISTHDMRTEYGTVARYDDVFVVDIPGSLPFGIAFYQERRANFSGMRILTGIEIRKQMDLLNSLWGRVGG